MLTITNGTSILTVTKGAYKSMYAPQGWEIQPGNPGGENGNISQVEEIEEIIQPEAENVTETKFDNQDGEETEDDESEVNLSEIPLSNMSVPQLKAYGKQLGIEVDTDSAKILRSRIRKAQEG